jgi:outer membrane lipoprotein-sorting protein
MATVPTSGQEVMIDEVINSVRSQLDSIESYEVDATFSVDIDFINMPDKKARIKYHRPDKLDIETDGFLMIPRMGLRPMSGQLSLEKYHTVYLGEDTITGRFCHEVKLLPKQKKNRIILATVWIDMEYFRINRWEAFTKKSGHVIVDFFYDSLVLPSMLVFSFEVSGMNLPLKYFGNEVEVDKEQLKASDVKEGKVLIRFENYQLTYITD